MEELQVWLCGPLIGVVLPSPVVTGPTHDLLGRLVDESLNVEGDGAFVAEGLLVILRRQQLGRDPQLLPIRAQLRRHDHERAPEIRRREQIK